MIIPFFDVETTGLKPMDEVHVVSICITLYDTVADKREVWYRLVKPPIPIPEEATKKHGITDEMVANEQPFSFYAQEIYNRLSYPVIAGHNIIKFDILVLRTEFERVQIEWAPDVKNGAIDTLVVMRKKIPMTLEGAHMYYTGKSMEEAHHAAADVSATIDVFKGQMSKYQMNEVKQAVSLSCEDMQNMVDWEGVFEEDQGGVIRFKVGKHKGAALTDIIPADKGFTIWATGPKGFTGSALKIIKAVTGVK